MLLAPVLFPCRPWNEDMYRAILTAASLGNIRVMDEYGRLVGDQLDLYTEDVQYFFECLECGLSAFVSNNF